MLASKFTNACELIWDLERTDAGFFHAECCLTAFSGLHVARYVQVTASFRNNAHLVKDDDVQTAKQAAIMAMGNYHALKAVDLATQYRDKQVLVRTLPKGASIKR